jgi:hypothetical protein
MGKNEEKNPWMAGDLAFNCILSVAIVTYAIFTARRLKIRLNRITRIKWAIAFIAILMRLALTISDFVRREYRGETAFIYYYLFLIDQAHFMIILTLFFTVIGSWKIIF